MIYLDNAASTLPSLNVQNTCLEVMDTFANPSSAHTMGQEAKRIINNTSEIIARKFNMDADDIYYTSGATMANNILIQGFLRENPRNLVITSTVEHDDIMLMSEYFHDRFYFVNVNNDGLLDLAELDSIMHVLSKRAASILVSVQMANSETGIIQNIRNIASVVHRCPNAYLHTDATQYLPYFPINVRALHIDALSMSGQKIRCIKGIGFLYKNKSLKIAPVIFGKQGLVGGTENVVGIACLGTAINDLNYDNKELVNKQFYLMGLLKDKYVLLNDNEYIIPNNICIYIPDYTGEQMVAILSDLGVCVSAGSACSAGDMTPSHVFTAMGYGDIVATHVLRVTLSNSTTYDELDEFSRLMHTIM